MLPPTNKRLLSQQGPSATSQAPAENPPPSAGSEVQPGRPGSFTPGGVQSCKGQRFGDSGDVEPDAGAEEGPWRKAFRGPVLARRGHTQLITQQGRHRNPDGEGLSREAGLMNGILAWLPDAGHWVHQAQIRQNQP